MRLAGLVLSLLLLSACLAPNERDPTRYPWVTPQPSYCIMSLERPGSAGIAVGGRTTPKLTCERPKRRL